LDFIFIQSSPQNLIDAGPIKNNKVFAFYPANNSPRSSTTWNQLGLASNLLFPYSRKHRGDSENAICLSPKSTILYRHAISDHPNWDYGKCLTGLV